MATRKGKRAIAVRVWRY